MIDSKLLIDPLLIQNGKYKLKLLKYICEHEHQLICFKIEKKNISNSTRYKARNNSGQIGLVPRNYLQELSEYLSQSYRGCPSNNDSMDRRNDTMNNSISPPPPMVNNSNNPIERPNLAGKTWYYGAITRSQCDTVLNSHGHDGDFLIRDSETNVSFMKK